MSYGNSPSLVSLSFCGNRGREPRVRWAFKTFFQLNQVGISSHFPVNQFLNVSFLNLVLDLIICLPNTTFFLYFAKGRERTSCQVGF